MKKKVYSTSKPTNKNIVLLDPANSEGEGIVVPNNHQLKELSKTMVAIQREWDAIQLESHLKGLVKSAFIYLKPVIVTETGKKMLEHWNGTPTSLEFLATYRRGTYMYLLKVIMKPALLYCTICFIRTLKLIYNTSYTI